MKISLNKVQIYSAGFFVVAALLVIFLVYPTIQDIKYSSGQILENKNQLIFAYEQSKAIEKFKDNYSSYESNLKKIDQIIVDPKDLLSLIKFFESSGLESGVDVTINLVESGQKDTIKGLPVITFTISANGEFSNMLNFSEKLERGPYLIKIKNLAMSKSSENSKNNIIDGQFSIYVGAQN